jgi:hypothetical protein
VFNALELALRARDRNGRCVDLPVRLVELANIVWQYTPF